MANPFRRVPAPEPPLRDELLSIERLEERAKSLAARFTVAPKSRRAKSLFPRLSDNAKMLRTAYATLAGDVHRGDDITPSAEWLLDHFNLVAGEIRAVRLNLPQAYYRELPRLAQRQWAGHARVYAMALELIRHSDSRLDRSQLVRFMNSYQSVAPLTIGELWAWPSILRLALIENLRRLAEEVLAARESRIAADLTVTHHESGRPLVSLPDSADMPYVVRLLQRVREYGLRLSPLHTAIDQHLSQRGMTTEDAIRSEHQRQAAAQVSIANVLTSLRLCSTLNWSDYFEAVSHVEQVLQRDPAGVYGAMDFLSRDRQRQAVEELAAPTGEAQERVALRAIESARQAAEVGSMTDRAAHVGYHLVGDGRLELEADLGYRPRALHRIGRVALRLPSLFYLGSVAAITALLIALGLAYVRSQAASANYLWIALLFLVPASEVAIIFVQRLVALFVKPRRLLRLELKDGIPPHSRTMVIVPTLLTTVPDIEELLERLEVAALANVGPRIHFAILSDFPDAPEPEMPDDAVLLAAARNGIDSLNQRFGPADETRFFLFHRERQWNAREQVWMGWERKRGKIEEFNRLLRGATDTSFTVPIGSRDILASVRYCLTLDSDTRLPRDAAKKLVGIISHPLNQAQLDPVSRRVVRGYGILQPRVSVTMASAAGSLFARIYAGHTGVDPYTTAVSDLYQDLFDEGIYTGKGLYDVDAFTAALENRVPENTVLSHDLFEGLHARTALVSDIEVVDDYPSSVLAHARRQHRWVRGDWQILLWLFPFVPTRTGLARNRLPLISRWKILDNLRRSLVAPLTVAMFIFGWTYLPGNPIVWTVATLAALTFSPVLWLLEQVAGPQPWQPWRVLLRNFIDDTKTALARACVQLIFLAYHACQMIDAIVVTLVRIAVTHRKMLEWQTAASSARLTDGAGRSDVRLFVEQMLGSPVLATSVLIAVAGLRSQALPAALPILLLWLAAPFVAYELSQPVAQLRPEIDEEDRRRLRLIARKTWRYFEVFVGAGDHGLPPDNFQETPQPTVAHRTSPTNIGMSLLAALAAHDLGFISNDELVERIDATLTTIEGLESFGGHLFNWYDSQSLAPLAPRYVSSVDSGNLAAALITLAGGLRQLPSEPKPPPDLSGLEEVTTLLERAVQSAERAARSAQSDHQKLGVAIRHIRTILSGSVDQDVKLAELEGPISAIDTHCGRTGIRRGKGPSRSRDRVLGVPTQKRHRRSPAAGVDSAGAARVAGTARHGPGGSDGLPPAVRQAARADVGRLPANRCREPRTPGRRLLRPARVRSTPRQLHRHRQGRCSGSALVPVGPAAHQYSGSADLVVVGSDAVRIPDAAPRDAELPRNPARRELSDGRAAADPVRQGTRCAVGRLRMCVQRRRPARHVSVSRLRRARARPETGPGRRSGGCAVRHGARNDDRTRRSGAKLSTAGSRRPRRSVWLLRRGGLHVRSCDPTDGGSFGRSRGVGTVVRTSMAHHQGMTLVSIANALLGHPMAERFHADPRMKATELLLQERVPRRAAITRPRPLEATRVAAPVAVDAVRRFRTPATQFPHAAFLSNGNYIAVVTNAGGGTSSYRGRSVTRSRRDPTRDLGGSFIYLRDVRTGAVWSATAQPLREEPQDYLVTLEPDRALFRRADDDIATNLEIAVSTEDDVEVRRLAIMNRSDRPREIEVTSYGEIVLATPAADLAHPAFGKLFVETEFLPDYSALICRRRPGGFDAEELWAIHVLSLEGRPQGALECETDRSRFLGRGRGPDDPQALDGRSLSNTSGATLDPIVSLRQRVRLAPGGFVRLSFATGMASNRETALRARAEIPRTERRRPNVCFGVDTRTEHSASPRHFE